MTYINWCIQNSRKYVCVCGYHTHNKFNMRRHRDSATCFIRRNKYMLPIELREMIASFIA